MGPTQVPVDVKDALGTFYRKSLGTADAEEARRLVPQKMHEFEALVRAVRTSRESSDLFVSADENPGLDELLARYQGQVLSGLSNAVQRRHLRVLEGFGAFAGMQITAPDLAERSRQIVEQWLVPKFGHTEQGRRA